jgi:hypothetical protein
MARRDVHIEIAVPTEGLHYEAPPAIITPRSSPNLRANAYYGVVQKEYGTSLYCTGTVPASVNALFEAKFSDSTILEAFSDTGMYKVAAGTATNDGQVYTATYVDMWSVCMHNDDMFYVNGKDMMQYKPTSAATGTSYIPTLSYKAHVILSFKEHLCLYNVSESGADSQKRCRWTKAGNLTYTASDFSTGVANFLDVQDIQGQILNALPMGGGMVAVYGDNTIHVQEWVGGTSVFLFTKMIENIEIPSARGIVANDAIHYVLTRDNVYDYKGGKTINAIGDAVKKDLFSVANPDYLNRAFLEYIREEDELRVWICATSTLPDTCYICKVKDNNAWYKVNRHATCAGKFKGGTSLTIGELQGNIGAQTWLFGDMQATGAAPLYLNGHSDGHIVKRDITRFSIISVGTSTAQDFLFDTKALSSINDTDPLVRNKYNLSTYKDNDTRWIKTQIECRGNGSMYVQYSTDEGKYFYPFPESPVSLDSDWKLVELDSDIAAPTFMVRVSNTGIDEYAAIDYMKVSFIPGAERVV